MTGEYMISMATAIYNKYFFRYTEIREDLINEGVLGIIKSEPFYSKERGNKSTFFWICAKRNMSIYIKKECRYRRIIAKDEIDDVCDFIPDSRAIVDVPYDANAEIDKIRQLLGKYTGRKKDISEDLLKGHKGKDISEKYGVTKQRVSQIFNDIKKKSNNIYILENGYLIEKENNNGKEI